MADIIMTILVFYVAVAAAVGALNLCLRAAGECGAAVIRQTGEALNEDE